MKMIGLLGGMSWESTASYYSLLNRGARQRGIDAGGGGLNSARLLLHSVDFAEVAARQHNDDWEGLTDLLSEAAIGLRNGGAEALVICTNTMHKLAVELERASGLKVIHIADATGQAIAQAGIERPLLLATKFTMEQDFYRTRVERHFEGKIVIPNADERTEVHRVIYQELCQGTVRSASRARCHEIIARAAQDQGIDGVIFGCTEVGLLLDVAALPVGLAGFDSTALHCKAALDWALSDAEC